MQIWGEIAALQPIVLDGWSIRGSRRDSSRYLLNCRPTFWRLASSTPLSDSPVSVSERLTKIETWFPEVSKCTIFYETSSKMLRRNIYLTRLASRERLYLFVQKIHFQPDVLLHIQDIIVYYSTTYSQKWQVRTYLILNPNDSYQNPFKLI
jgi:hypothetical protein